MVAAKGRYELNASRAHAGAPWCTDTDSRQEDRELARSPKGEAKEQTRRQHETEVDTEAGMLSGVSRKRSIRSSPCWFTEFCKSQCLSHFAAPFIVVRAETSVAESCKKAITEQRFPPTGNTGTTQVMRSLVAGRQRGQHLPPRRLAHTHAQAANNHQAQPKSRAS